MPFDNIFVGKGRTGHCAESNVQRGCRLIGAPLTGQKAGAGFGQNMLYQPAGRSRWVVAIVLPSTGFCFISRGAQVLLEPRESFECIHYARPDSAKCFLATDTRIDSTSPASSGPSQRASLTQAIRSWISTMFTS